MMLFAGLLSLRKRLKKTKWPILDLPTWQKGHIWFGALSMLMVLLHGGFRRGGPLTTMLLMVLAAILSSGIAGLFLQHLLAFANADIRAQKGGKVATGGRIVVVSHKLNMFLHKPLTATLFVLLAAHIAASMIF